MRALITGGAQGIGLAVASRLASAGVDAVIGDLKVKGEQAARAAEQCGAQFVELDVTDPGSVQQALANTGSIDILVNCAGTTNGPCPVDDVTLTEWNRVLAVNLTGTFICIQSVAPGMRNRGFGRIINIASSVATRGIAGTAAYAASKAGVIGLTRAVAADLAPSGITVNAISPGYVDTAMTQGLPDGVRKSRLAEIGVGRFAEPGEVAVVVNFLASAEAGYITGATIDVSGGFRI